MSYRFKVFFYARKNYVNKDGEVGVMVRISLDGQSDKQYIKLIQNKINRRPREKLNFQTPSKIFFASLNRFVAFVT